MTPTLIVSCCATAPDHATASTRLTTTDSVKAARFMVGSPLRAYFPSSAARLSNHEADVRAAARIRVEHVLQLPGRNAQPHRHREEVDDLGGVGAEQVGAQNALGALLDEDLEDGR